MDYLPKNLFTARNGRILIALLNLVSVILSVRALFKTKSTLRALLHLVNASVSGYMLFRSSKELKTYLKK